MQNIGNIQEAMKQAQPIIDQVMGQAKDLHKGVSWNAQEFSTFAEAQAFLKGATPLQVQVVVFMEKICIFYAKG